MEFNSVLELVDYYSEDSRWKSAFNVFLGDKRVASSELHFLFVSYLVNFCKLLSIAKSKL